MELELTKVELKREITSAKDRVEYLESILGTNEIKDSYTTANDKNFNKLVRIITTIEGLKLILIGC